MCFVLQNDLGKGRCAPVASPAKWCFPIPFAWPDQKAVMQGPDQHPRGDFALPDSPAKAELPPSTKGRACPLRPSRLQRGKGAFCAPLDPMTKGAFRQPLWKPSTNCTPIGCAAYLEDLPLHLYRTTQQRVYSASSIKRVSIVLL